MRTTLVSRLSALGSPLLALCSLLSALGSAASAEMLLTTITGDFEAIQGNPLLLPVDGFDITDNGSTQFARFSISAASEGTTQRIEGAFPLLNADLTMPLMMYQAENGQWYEFLDSMMFRPMGYQIWNPQVVSYRQMFVDGTHPTPDICTDCDTFTVDSNVVSPNNYNLHGTPHSVSAIELTINNYETIVRHVEGIGDFHDFAISYTVRFFSPAPEPSSLMFTASCIACLLLACRRS